MVLALLAAAIATTSAQEINCQEEFFRTSRFEERCDLFFVCMISRRVNFFCDPGYIYDQERIACRPGYPDTCEYAIEIIPTDEKLEKFAFASAF